MAFGLAGDSWVSAGGPATDRSWNSEDYKKLLELVVTKKVPLPTFADETGRKILDQACSLENLGLCQNKTLPLAARMLALMDIQTSANGLNKLYMAEAAKGGKVGGEISHLLAFLLQTAAVGIALADEFVLTIPKDETYEVRMNGLAQMLKGMANMFVGCYTSISSDEIYTDADRSLLLAALADTASSFVPILGADTQAEMRIKLTDLRLRFSNEGDRDAIDRILALLPK